MKASQLNKADIKATMVLNRAELKRMLDFIPADSESGEAACGIFLVRVYADKEDGKVGVGAEHWARLPGDVEMTLIGYPDLTRVIEPTALEVTKR